MHRPVVTSRPVRLLRRGAAVASSVLALGGVLLTGGPTAAQWNAIHVAQAKHTALVERVRVLQKVSAADADWNDRQQHRAAVATSAAVRSQLAAELTALRGRLDAVQAAVVGAPVEAGRESLVDTATAAVTSARAVVDAGSLLGARPLVVQAEAAAVEVAASVQARAAAEAAAAAAAAAAAQAAAEQAAAEQAAAEAAAARRATTKHGSAKQPAPARAAAPARSSGGGDGAAAAPASSAWDDVRAAAAGAAGSYGLSVSWVATTACGQSGSVSAGSFSIRGCSSSGSSTIQLSFGGGDPGAYQGSRSKLVSYVRAVALHEAAHKQIERLTGTMFPTSRYEALADAYAATYLGMPASLASYGFTGDDVALAEAIHDNRW